MCDTMATPRISVLMTVYNGGAYLRPAIDSILCQDTDDFELVVVDDGSTDGSTELLEGLTDPRVALVQAPHAGLVTALNLGIAKARGAYIARMDADDIARPDRLRVQSAYLDSHPEIGILCSNVRIINGEGRVTGRQQARIDSRSKLREGLLYRAAMKPIIHPSVMMRREVVERLGGYREFSSAEDRDFWLRASREFDFHRLKEELLDYRIHAGGISRVKSSQQATSSAMAAVMELVFEQTGIDLFGSVTAAEETEKMRARLERDVLGPTIAFRAARNRMGAERFRGGIDLSLVLLKHGFKATSRGSREATLQIIEEAAARLVDTLGTKVV